MYNNYGTSVVRAITVGDVEAIKVSINILWSTFSCPPVASMTKGALHRDLLLVNDSLQLGSELSTWQVGADLSCRSAKQEQFSCAHLCSMCYLYSL
jgi:hypothetical protein